MPADPYQRYGDRPSDGDASARRQDATVRRSWRAHPVTGASYSLAPAGCPPSPFPATGRLVAQRSWRCAKRLGSIKRSACRPMPRCVLIRSSLPSQMPARSSGARPNIGSWATMAKQAAARKAGIASAASSPGPRPAHWHVYPLRRHLAGPRFCGAYVRHALLSTQQQRKPDQAPQGSTRQ